jgi:hypothetical protein
MKNINIKDIVIFVLLLGCLFFGYRSFFSSDNLYKYKVEELRKQNDSLFIEKSIIDEILIKLSMEFDSLKIIEENLIEEINQRDIDIERSKNKADQSRKELDKYRKEIEETKRKIEWMKENPANRTGENLINSLKSKSKP